MTGLSSCVRTLRGVYHHARARRLGAGTTRACPGAVDAGVATAPSAGAAAAKTVLSVAAELTQAANSLDAEHDASMALNGDITAPQAPKTMYFYWFTSKYVC